jgi:hypothetical protein
MTTAMAESPLPSVPGGGGGGVVNSDAAAIEPALPAAAAAFVTLYTEFAPHM